MKLLIPQEMIILIHRNLLWMDYQCPCQIHRIHQPRSSSIATKRSSCATFAINLSFSSFNSAFSFLNAFFISFFSLFSLLRASFADSTSSVNCSQSPQYWEMMILGGVRSFITICPSMYSPDVSPSSSSLSASIAESPFGLDGLAGELLTLGEGASSPSTFGSVSVSDSV